VKEKCLQPVYILHYSGPCSDVHQLGHSKNYWTEPNFGWPARILNAPIILSFNVRCMPIHETCSLWTFSQRSDVKTAWQKLAVGWGPMAAGAPYNRYNRQNS